MKISDINRELYRDDIARIEEELVIFRNMLRRAIIKDKGRILFKAYKSEVMINGKYYCYPDKISFGCEIELNKVSDVNKLMEDIVIKLRNKYCVDFKYKKIRIYPKMKQEDIIFLSFIIICSSIIACFIALIVSSSYNDEIYICITFKICISVLVIYLGGATIYCSIYERWLS